MKRSILLVTERYPYGTAETFIANELPFLASDFDVTILPLNPLLESRPRRVPSTVRVALPTGRPRSRLGRQLHGLWESGCLLTHATRADFHAIFHNPARLFPAFSYISRVRDAQSAIRALLENTSFDIVYSYWFDVAALAVLLEREDRNESFIVISRAHGFDVRPERHGGWFPLRSWAMMAIDRVFVVCDDLRRVITDEFPQASNKVTVDRLGTLDHGIATPEEPEHPAGDKHPICVVSVSNIVDVKRLDLLIDALGELESITKREIMWTHVGDGPLKRQMQDRARLKLHTVKWFFSGHLPNNELIEFLRSHHRDFLVNTSDSEAIPVTMMEALSLGIPVIARRVGGIPEIVKNGVTGYLTKAQPTALDIATTILNGVNLPAQTALHLRHDARQFWEDNFQATTNAKKFAAALGALLSEPQR